MNNEGLIYQCIAAEEAATAQGDVLGASVARQQGRELMRQRPEAMKRAFKGLPHPARVLTKL